MQRVQGRVLASKSFHDVDEIDADNQDSYQVATEHRQVESKALGSEVANDPAALRHLMPEIVRGGGNLWYFGMGLAHGAKNPRNLWYDVVEQFAATPSKERDYRALCGFLHELDTNKSTLPDELLDHALENEPLAPYFPWLQDSVVITPRGMARLNKSVELRKVPIHAYSGIHLGRAVEAVPAADIARYVTALAKASDGGSVAIDVLSRLFFSDRQDKRAHAPEIVEAGRELLPQMEFDRKGLIKDYYLQEVVEVCVAGDGGYEAAKAVCDNLKRAAAEHKTYGLGHNLLLKALLKVQARGSTGCIPDR